MRALEASNCNYEFVFFFLLSVLPVFAYLEALLLVAYTVSELTFSQYVISNVLFALRSVMSYINIVSPVFLLFIYGPFYSFNHILLVAYSLAIFPPPSDNLCLLIGMFKSFAFHMNIAVFGFRAIICYLQYFLYCGKNTKQKIYHLNHF